MRIICKIILASFIAILLIGATLWAFLQNYGGEFLNSHLEAAQKRTGHEISVGSLDVTFLPLPAFAISDLRIKGQDFTLSAPWSFARPDFLALFSGKFLPAEITLLRPALRFHFDFPVSELPSRIKRENAGASEKKVDIQAVMTELFGDGCRFRISQGDIRVRGTTRTAVFLDNLSANFFMGGSSRIDGHLEIERFALRDREDQRYILRNIGMEGDIALDVPFASGNSLYLKTAFSLADRLRHGFLEARYNTNSRPHVMDFTVRGDLTLSGNSEPLNLDGRLDFDWPKRLFNLHQLNWQLGSDSGKVVALVRLPEQPMDFSVEGDFIAHRLSLTQWLGFARNLCPGLQLSLDNIYNANLNFKLDSRKVWASQIRAMCNGSLFLGSGGVADFSSPVVYLDLETGETNLGQALGEAVGHSPVAPGFPYPPLTPLPGEPLKPGETGIGYDINIGAKRLLYGPFVMDNAHLRIYPGEIDKDGLEEVLLAGKAGFYGGNIIGTCILGSPVWLPVTIKGKAARISAKALGRALRNWPFASGSFSGTVDVTTQGKELTVFLSHLKGKINVTGEEAVLGKTFDLNRLEGACALKSGTLAPDRVEFNGDWNLSVNAKEFTGNAALNGKVAFNEHGAIFKNLPFQLNLETEKGQNLIKSGWRLNGAGQAALNMATGNLELNDTSFDATGVALSGSVSVDYRKMALKGKLATKNLDFLRLTAGMGIKRLNLPAYLTPSNLAGDIQVEMNNYKFRNMRLDLPAGRITGVLDCKTDRQKPHFSFSLGSDKLIFPESGSSGSKEKEWNLNFLNEFEADGTFSIHYLDVANTIIHNLKLPLIIRNDILEINNGEGKLYGGMLNLSGNAHSGRQISTSVRVNARGINLEQAAKATKPDLLLKGTGLFNANLRSSGNRSSQILSNLDGTCDFLASNGSWQTLDKKGEPKGKPTFFSKIQASAKITKGRFTTSDLQLTGPDMQIAGHGYLNLVKRDLDYTLNVNMKGVPDFPLYIYGPFSSPKTRIGAGKLVLNALGSVASGVGNILGGIGQGFAKIFKK